MGGETFVISSVTAGLQTQWGSATVENVAQGATFQGFLSSRLSQALVRDTQSTYLSFAFTDLSVYSGRLDFTPTQRPFLPQSFDSLLFGQTVVENTAQAIYLESIPPVAIGLPLVADRSPWLFDFVALPANDLALHFTFGGARLVVPQGVASFEAGAFTIEAPWTITFEGFELSRFGQALVSFELPLTFDFVGLAENDLAIQFNFGGAALVLPGGIDSFRPGAAVVENAAQAIQPVGIPPVRFGLPLVSASEPLLFDFVEVTQPNAANIPFNFGASRRADFEGFDSFASGVPYLVSLVRFSGCSLTEYGQAVLSGDGFGIYLFQGFESSRIGQFTATRLGAQIVDFGDFSGVDDYWATFGFDSLEMGIPSVFDPVIPFIGTELTRYGQPSVRHKGQLLFSGFDSFVAGIWRRPASFPVDPRITEACWTRQDIVKPHSDDPEVLEHWEELAEAEYPDGEGLVDAKWLSRDRANSERLLAHAKGLAGYNVFESIDGGRTWQAISSYDDRWLPIYQDPCTGASASVGGCATQCIFGRGGNQPIIIGNVAYSQLIRRQNGIWVLRAAIYDLLNNEFVSSLDHWTPQTTNALMFYNPKDGFVYVVKETFGAGGLYSVNGGHWQQGIRDVGDQLESPVSDTSIWNRATDLEGNAYQITYFDGFFFFGGFRTGVCNVEDGRFSGIYRLDISTGDFVSGMMGLFFIINNELYFESAWPHGEHKVFKYHNKTFYPYQDTIHLGLQNANYNNLSLAHRETSSPSAYTSFIWASQTHGCDDVTAQYGQPGERILAQPVFELSDALGRRERIHHYHTPVLPRHLASDGDNVVVMGADMLRPMLFTDEPGARWWAHQVVGYDPAHDPGNLNAPHDFRIYRFDWLCFKAVADSRFLPQQYAFETEEESTEWGEETFVSHFNRVLPPIPGFYTTQFGVSWLSHSPRTVEFRSPAEIPLYFGHFQVGYHRDVEMASPFEMTQWGIPHVDLRRFILEGLDSLQFPEFFRVTRSPRPVQPFSWDARALGEPFVWNLTQFVEFVAPDTNPDTYKGVRFGRLHWFKVLNVARVVQLSGLDSLRFASSPFDAVLAGRAVVLQGFDSLTYPPFNEWQRHLVAYAVRSVPMWGLDSFRAVTYHRIHNDAWLAAFSGAESGAFGRAFVWRWMQRVHAQGRRHDESGLPWVEFGVRSFQMRTPRQMLQMPHIIVGHTPLHIEMEGLHSFGFTNLFSFARPIPRIYPRWDIQYWDARNFTPPRVWNVTPELRMFGRNMLRVGDKPFVWFRVRDVAVNGWNSFLTDGFVIARRDRELPIPGFQSSVINQDFYVVRFGPGLPFDQIVRMDGHNQAQYGGATVTGNTLRFTGLDSSTKPDDRWGRWAIFGHNIAFDGGSFRNQTTFESGDFAVLGGERVVTFEGREPGVPSKFSLSPHTIWMRSDTPQQARQNHPGNSFCRVDAFCGGSTPPGYSGPSTWPWWGSARVRFKDGVDESVQMRSANNWGVPYIAITLGQPRVENEIRTIYPDSWESFWQGYPTVTTPTDSFVDIWSGDQSTSLAFGEIRVDPYPPRPRWLLPSGVLPVSFGQHDVQNQHREVYLIGLNATQWGNNEPMVYHYPRGFTPIDSDMTQWGTQWLSHSPRWYTLGGTDFFTSRWTDLPLRMRIELEKRYIFMYKGNEFTRYSTFSVTASERRVEMYGFVWPNTCSDFEVRHV